jgi:hypothetical protein
MACLTNPALAALEPSTTIDRSLVQGLGRRRLVSPVIFPGIG